MKVTANLGCVSPHFHGVRVYGTEATFHNGLPHGVVYSQPSPEEPMRQEQVTAAYPGVQKGDLIFSFVESIVSGAPARVTAQDVFDTLAVCFAIERAMASGGREDVRGLG